MPDGTHTTELPAAAGSGHTPTPELAKQYRPSEHEDRIFARWIENKAFHADPERVRRGDARPYCVLIPPPNVTAALHLGHALNNTIQDALVRAYRMKGYEALWMPGTDHAGIATQAVVEKRVMKEEKKRRGDFTREAFIEKIQAFKDEYEAVITGQLKKMGCSCDWDRQRFTMDSVCARAVREAFFRLFKDGLIYRGKRLVNWDPVLQTAVADDECYDEEIDGAFYYLRYPLVHKRGMDTQHERLTGQFAPEDPVPVTWSTLAARGYPDAHAHPAEEQAWITVATTRPETYLGDTGVAINPHDPRAKALRGMYVELPLVGRVIPIVEDSYVVLPERYARTDEELNDPKAKMATGFLKVTPAHDPNDYEIGLRHNLDLVNVFAPDATISDKHGWSKPNELKGAHIFLGKKREEARKLVVKEFEARGRFEGSKPHRHSVKHSDRSKAVIEPYLSDQWYVRVTDPRMAKAANEALEGSEKDTTLTFHPARYAKTYQQWHDGIRDWCISRQLWWGHRIPVWSSRAAWVRSGERGKLPQPSLDQHALHRVQRLEGLLKAWQQNGRLAVSGRVDFTSPHVDELDDTTFVCLRDPDPEIESVLAELTFVQDPDVLDTWFSSGLWPLSTMGWPDAEQAAKETSIGDFPALLDAFNPTSALCTAREIITLWVSRMVMFNRYFMGQDKGQGPGKGQVPYRDVFIHAVIQDGEGRKMSKTLGNGVDPLDIIATHGADAMRFTLLHMTTQTQDVRMPVVKDSATGRNTSPKFDLGRNFANKLWNAARFSMSMLAKAPPGPVLGGLSLVDRWMLSRLCRSVRAIDAALAEYQFSEYAQACYDLLWRDFCDWYVEAIKPTAQENPAQRAVLRTTLDAILRLLHPATPFVTEAIFEHLSAMPSADVPGVKLGAARKGSLLCTAGWPVVDDALLDEAAEARFERLRSLITAIREVRSQNNTPPKRQVVLHAPQADAAWLADAECRTMLCTLAGLREVKADGATPQGSSAAFTFEAREFRLSELADAADPAAEKDRLTKVVAEKTKLIATLEARLANPGYAQKAPPHMVQQTRDELAKAQAERDAAQAAMKSVT